MFSAPALLIAALCASCSVVMARGQAVGVGTPVTTTFEADRTAFRPFITHWEGCSATVLVRRSTGERVIGIGHNVRFGYCGVVTVGRASSCHHPLRLTPSQITALYNRDFAQAYRACAGQIHGFGTLPQPARFVALSVAWTCGATGLHRWTAFRRALSRGNLKGAATQLRLSRWAHQVGADRVASHQLALLSCCASSSSTFPSPLILTLSH